MGRSGADVGEGLDVWAAEEGESTRRLTGYAELCAWPGAHESVGTVGVGVSGTEMSTILTWWIRLAVRG